MDQSVLKQVKRKFRETHSWFTFVHSIESQETKCGNIVVTIIYGIRRRPRAREWWLFHTSTEKLKKLNAQQAKQYIEIPSRLF